MTDTITLPKADFDTLVARLFLADALADAAFDMLRQAADDDDAERQYGRLSDAVARYLDIQEG